ncbi:folliculin-interacting protein 2 [Callorhinchus milii]|uniref:folliculin-interacting protein 2 n=1 Tax=Callorhinchus milii TaxID=7868 RepID=UPI001C3FDAAC|nr:folliculin-interacting protein 2 [Callorhinchus milii]
MKKDRDQKDERLPVSNKYSAGSWSPAEFEISQIRLIIYQDCERRGRHVLFDSKAVRKVNETTVQKNTDDLSKPYGRYGHLGASGPCSGTSSQNSSSAGVSKTKEQMPRYQYSRPASDVNMLGEMMFGSVAMSYKGSTLKIHYIRSPPQLMISKVFSAKMGSAGGSSNTLQDSFEYINQENTSGKPCPSQNGSHCRADSNLAHSTPVDMPSRGQNEDRDSGIARSASLSSLLATPFPSPNSFSSSSCASSFQRRWLRSQTTSLEHGIFPRWSAEETFSMADENYTSNPQMVRRKKIAISVVFSLPEKDEENRNFQEFFFSHFPLFETHLNKLKSSIEKAMITCRKIAESSQRVQVYINRVMEALGEFRTTIWNLYTGPRVPEPVWLTMMFNASEKSRLCCRFLQELTTSIEQMSRNQFLPALLTAVLTYHLAWVPTVMPNDHPPVRTFYEKQASQSVDLLGKSHPYNPLWAQLGDVYGAIGSPVRLSRTVVVGKRKELVQRLLYVLTYFIRCSDLQENHLESNEMPQDSQTELAGNTITTALERGEVEESDYVVVSLHKDEPAPVSPTQSLTSSVKTNGCTGTVTATDNRAQVAFKPLKAVQPKAEADNCRRQPSVQCSEASPLVSDMEDEDVNTCKEAVQLGQEARKEVLTVVKGASLCTAERRMLFAPETVVSLSEQLPDLSDSALATAAEVASSPPLKNSPTSGLSCPARLARSSPQLQQRVLFQIGCSLSPDSDIEARRKDVEEKVKNFREQRRGEQDNTNCQLQETGDILDRDKAAQPAEDRLGTNRAVQRLRPSPRLSFDQIPSYEGSTSIFDECFTEGNTTKTYTAGNLSRHNRIVKETIKPCKSSDGERDVQSVETNRTLCGSDAQATLRESIISHSGNQGRRSGDVPRREAEDSEKKVAFRIEVDIPRNVSSDSALGDSDDEDAAHERPTQKPGCYGERWEGHMEELELPLPSIKMNSRPSLNNFGRSLLGGYCSQYVPDFALQGISSDEKLKQCLMADLAHAVQHPVLDEPIAESVCIIADTDKWSVQVATSQRKVMDSNKLGKEVLVSNLVSSLLQSILQLYKLQLPPDYCVMHLEDRLQELYFKSKMLSEYLKGHTRVHVKELGVVLGIESNDLPLLAAAASTHSPYVAQILL